MYIMKKLISMLLCLVLVASMTTPTFAAENQTELTLTVPADMETYELTIPAAVDIDVTNKTGSVSVKLSNVVLVWSKTLRVDVTSANGGYLVNDENTNLKMLYQIKNGYTNQIDKDGFTTIDTVAEYRVGSASNDFSTNGSLEITVLDSYPGAGTYTDTLTFTVNFS